MGFVSFEFVMETFEKWYSKLLAFFTLFFEPIRVDIYDILLDLGMSSSIATAVQKWIDQSWIGDVSLAGLVLYGLAAYVILQLIAWLLSWTPVL